MNIINDATTPFSNLGSNNFIAMNYYNNNFQYNFGNLTLSGNATISGNTTINNLSVIGSQAVFKNNVSVEGSLDVLKYIRIGTGSYNEYIGNQLSPFIYGTGQSKGFPFNTLGNLVIQSRSSTEATSIIFIAGSSMNPVMVINGAGIKTVQIGLNASSSAGKLDVNGTIYARGNSTAPPILLSINITNIVCNTSNEGGIMYSANVHYGCNSTNWNALY